VWAISQAKQKKRSKHKTTFETDLNVHLPTESEQVPAWLNLDKWSLGKTKEARLQVEVVVWRKMGVVAMKTIPNRLR
jgi:hypothetical protein